MPTETTDDGAPGVSPSLELNVAAIQQGADELTPSPASGAEDLDADSSSTEATLDGAKFSEIEDSSNPNTETTLSQEIEDPAAVVGGDEDSVLQEPNYGDSGDDDPPPFEGYSPKGRISSSVSGRPPPKPKPRPR